MCRNSAPSCGFFTLLFRLVLIEAFGHARIWFCRKGDSFKCVWDRSWNNCLELLAELLNFHAVQWRSQDFIPGRHFDSFSMFDPSCRFFYLKEKTDLFTWGFNNIHYMHLQPSWIKRLEGGCDAVLVREKLKAREGDASREEGSIRIELGLGLWQRRDTGYE